MNAANPQAKVIFGQALAIDAPVERAAYLEQACGGDAALRAEVESLLAALEGADDFLKQPAAAQGVTVDTEPQEAVGSCIGPYKLLQRLGEGGMGVVWVAEQQEPVKRRVALKVIKPGMDSAQVLRRFEAERRLSASSATLAWRATSSSANRRCICFNVPRFGRNGRASAWR